MCSRHSEALLSFSSLFAQVAYPTQQAFPREAVGFFVVRLPKLSFRAAGATGQPRVLRWLGYRATSLLSIRWSRMNAWSLLESRDAAQPNSLSRACSGGEPRAIAGARLLS